MKGEYNDKMSKNMRVLPFCFEFVSFTPVNSCSNITRWLFRKVNRWLFFFLRFRGYQFLSFISFRFLCLRNAFVFILTGNESRKNHHLFFFVFHEGSDVFCNVILEVRAKIHMLFACPLSAGVERISGFPHLRQRDFIKFF